MRRLLSLLLLAILLMPVHAQDNLPPYIYYYSNALNAFVVERADGSDSRLLGQGLMAIQRDLLVSGPGWSPDGNWLAWSALGSFVVHANGVDRLERLDAFASATMHWSPDSRWLLVSGHLKICSDYPNPCHHRTYWLVDMNSRQVVTSFDLRPTMLGAPYIIPIEWDQAHVTFYDAEDLGHVQYYRITMDFSGSMTKQAISREAFNAVHSHDLDTGERVLLDSPSGRYTALAYSATLNDTETGDTIPLPLHSESASGSSPMEARWHPSEAWVLLGFNAGETSSYVGYVTVMSLDGTIHRELSSCGFHPTCVNWLPDTVNIEQLPPGREGSMLPVPIHYDYDVALEYGPGDREPYLLVCDETTNLFNLVQDVATGEVVFTLEEERPCFHPEAVQHFPFALSPNGMIYAANAGATSRDYTALYNAATGDLLAVVPVLGWELSFSADGLLLMMRSKNARITWDVQALLRSAERLP